MSNFFILSSFSVQLRQPILGKGARVVAMTLDQVYMLKVEGIGFHFLPDPLQIKNALALKSANVSRRFDGVPVFQEDIERELLKVSKASSGSEFSHDIMVESLEDVLKNWRILLFTGRDHFGSIFATFLFSMTYLDKCDFKESCQPAVPRRKRWVAHCN